MGAMYYNHLKDKSNAVTNSKLKYSIFNKEKLSFRVFDRLQHICLYMTSRDGAGAGESVAAIYWLYTLESLGL